ncbi:MAG: cytidylate kinase-like family protein [Syntrophales bacterium LBB04]|nr:cytidylate kinase-like family protein [Syntrophales bacterium LBB04]
MVEERRVAITVSRQMGSGGSYIGYLVARQLGFKYIDREILRQAASRLGTDTRLLEKHDERSCGIFEKLLTGFTFGTPETAYVPPVNRPIYDKDLFAVESRIMEEIVDRHNAVITGRAGFHVLKERHGVIRVFIHAPLEFRVKRVMRAQRIVETGQARADVEESDRRRAKFVRDMVGVDWTDARNYHLCIDSSAVGFPASVEMIVKLVEKSLHGDDEKLLSKSSGMVESGQRTTWGKAWG